ncbi:protein WHAT'S THIS FACTOR 9, mitochondrial [Lolium perenne]|uniref:protein WHAT'S THIS FACTOR 9, mitochondrial n=1 Tax=Lolium perenne TaxID=4522 RepID=UPI0021EB30A9|nr:protein WHAT'S THIS FACTOR 9, mitochondrial [Lolium perenne]XP_051177879.1 protein WHAT'S THIS FACTOR 9, mitochondrial [Lolium perenne]XP_051177880.1 protein WHAT'S THIS FACTOR 9, mitochondrial [Lolium perenne]
MRSLAKARPPKPLCPLAAFVQSMGYVDVKMRWKKDASFDGVPVLAHARDLRPLAALARLLSPSPTPVSAVSKLRRSLETSDRRVAAFLRRFPAAFVESVGPEHHHPWFRLSAPAARLLQEERDVFAARRADIASRLRRLLLMSPARRLPLSVAQGMLWHLGLPEDYFRRPEFDIGQDGFRILTTAGDGAYHKDENDGKELGLIDDVQDQEMPLSVLQTNAIRRFGSADEVPIPLFPSKGLRLKHKIGDWLERFQKLPYVSPYEDFSNIQPGTDVSQKRVAGVLHELFSLFVTCSAERRRLLCLRTHLGLPQKFDRGIERHPHIFYLLLKEKTCFVVLKEAYMAGGDTAIEEHPMLAVRSKYAGLMEESREIIKRRRSGKPVQLDPEDQEESEDWKDANSIGTHYF